MLIPLFLALTILQHLREGDYYRDISFIQIMLIVGLMALFFFYLLISPSFFTYAVELTTERGFAFLTLFHWFATFGHIALFAYLNLTLRKTFDVYKQYLFYVFITYMILSILVNLLLQM